MPDHLLPRKFPMQSADKRPKHPCKYANPEEEGIEEYDPYESDIDVYSDAWSERCVRCQDTQLRIALSVSAHAPFVSLFLFVLLCMGHDPADPLLLHFVATRPPGEVDGHPIKSSPKTKAIVLSPSANYSIPRLTVIERKAGLIQCNCSATRRQDNSATRCHTPIPQRHTCFYLRATDANVESLCMPPCGPYRRWGRHLRHLRPRRRPSGEFDTFGFSPDGPVVILSGFGLGRSGPGVLCSTHSTDPESVPNSPATSRHILVHFVLLAAPFILLALHFGAFPLLHRYTRVTLYQGCPPISVEHKRIGSTQAARNQRHDTGDRVRHAVPNRPFTEHQFRPCPPNPSASEAARSGRRAADLLDSTWVMAHCPRALVWGFPASSVPEHRKGQDRGRVRKGNRLMCLNGCATRWGGGSACTAHTQTGVCLPVFSGALWWLAAFP